MTGMSFFGLFVIILILKRLYFKRFNNHIIINNVYLNQAVEYKSRIKVLFLILI